MLIVAPSGDECCLPFITFVNTKEIIGRVFFVVVVVLEKGKKKAPDLF